MYCTSSVGVSLLVSANVQINGVGCFCELILDSWCRSLRKMAQIASPRIKRFRWCAVLPQVTCYESQGSIFESIKIEIFDCPTQLMVKYDVCCSVGP